MPRFGVMSKVTEIFSPADTAASLIEVLTVRCMVSDRIGAGDWAEIIAIEPRQNAVMSRARMPATIP